MSKLSRAIGGNDPRQEAVLALTAAHQAHVKLKIEPLKTSIANATIMTAAIEHVGEYLIINQPDIDGVSRPLLDGEQLRLSFSLKEIGHVMGEAEVIGRFKIPSGGDGEPLHGYRLTIPKELFPDERRDSDRAGSVNLAREVELYRSPSEEPIRGVVTNLSQGGMQIRTHNPPEPPLRSGERVRLIVHLPPPVGGINRMVSIARLAGKRNPRHRIVGISFEREIPGLRELLKQNSNAA